MHRADCRKHQLRSQSCGEGRHRLLECSSYLSCAKDLGNFLPKRQRLVLCGCAIVCAGLQLSASRMVFILALDALVVTWLMLQIHY